MKYTLMAIVIVFIISCRDEANLGYNYYYLSKYDAMDIGMPLGAIVYKSDNKNSFNNVIIYGDVLQCVSNSKYVLALQKPNKKSIYSEIRNSLVYWSKYYAETKKDSSITLPSYPNAQIKVNVSLKNVNYLQKMNINESDKVLDSLFKNNTVYQKQFKSDINYWIINILKDSLIGPLSKDEFIEKRNEMKIPDNLQLK
jgi:hypothetical protein